MSTVETKPAVVVIKRTYEAYNSALKLVTSDQETSYQPVDNPNDALAELSRINDYIRAANYMLKTEALTKAREAAGVSGGINREYLMNFIRPWRDLPNFSGMIIATDKRKATADEYNKQTEAILEQIRQVPILMQQIIAGSAAANSQDE